MVLMKFPRFLMQRSKPIAQDKLRNFDLEMARNLEACYVMEQLGSRKLLSMTWGETLRQDEGVVLPAEIQDYLAAVQVYNALFVEKKNYEDWYRADVNRQTRENALVLHEKGERLDESFSGLKMFVQSACNIQKTWHSREVERKKQCN